MMNQTCKQACLGEFDMIEVDFYFFFKLKFLKIIHKSK